MAVICPYKSVQAIFLSLLQALMILTIQKKPTTLLWIQQKHLTSFIRSTLKCRKKGVWIVFYAGSECSIQSTGCAKALKYFGEDWRLNLVKLRVLAEHFLTLFYWVYFEVCVCVCVVYFDHLLGVACTQKLVKILFWSFSTFFLVPCTGHIRCGTFYPKTFIYKYVTWKNDTERGH